MWIFNSCQSGVNRRRKESGTFSPPQKGNLPLFLDVRPQDLLRNFGWLWGACPRAATRDATKTDRIVLVEEPHNVNEEGHLKAG